MQPQYAHDVVERSQTNMNDPMIELVQHTISFVESRNAKIDSVKDYLSKSHLNREFKTIHLNVGRCSGKTHTICTLARKDDLIVVANEAIKRRLISDYPYCLATIGTISEIIINLGSGLYIGIQSRGMDHYFPRVWIDEPYLCDDYKDINALYDLIDADLFIRLGE